MLMGVPHILREYHCPDCRSWHKLARFALYIEGIAATWVSALYYSGSLHPFCIQPGYSVVKVLVIGLIERGFFVYLLVPIP